MADQSTHLTSLEVKGFRPFQHLELTDLARVNLVVGKNSVGKTSLLEALALLATEGSPRQIRDLLHDRREISIDRTSETEDDRLPLLSIYQLNYNSLFWGRPDLALEQPSFRIEGKAKGFPDPYRLDVSAGLYIEENVTVEGTVINRIRRASDRTEEEEGGFVGVGVNFMGQESVVIPDRTSRFVRSRIRKSDSFGYFQFVPAEGFPPSEASLLWDGVALRPEEENVYQALRLIRPDLERVVFVGGTSSRVERFALARLSGTATPVPLRSLGEGINHLFGIAAALAASRGGMLLVDEVENGLHYSVMADLWKVILQQSRELDVQVFATTHSLDCLRGFQAATQGLDPTEARLIRLEGADGIVKGIPFDPEELDLVMRGRIEVR
ncbi:AAA family ATPase [Pararhodospirillum oryzae]|uniref:ATPase AAA-type core domain-containing protein n=1 Tax=Pararhodospirillum oryzae TaxID=478448 RepID=A0A512H6T3_9PROT|nr:ATP-binding protein [Pararhodospirillum oryzae]GEO81185.1 hypothetical protein ROR02_13160 [Pararhodospirillum oryzae]